MSSKTARTVDVTVKQYNVPDKRFAGLYRFALELEAKTGGRVYRKDADLRMELKENIPGSWPGGWYLMYELGSVYGPYSHLASCCFKIYFSVRTRGKQSSKIEISSC